ncbi:MAG: hypothetical protein CMJ50_01105 [Planctomycetaceae bacterium]|nr:hypothetical protein [Planctomycetaceae bacterium]
MFSAAETPNIQQRARASKVLDAMEFLTEYLVQPRHFAEVLAAGKKRGLSRTTIYDARQRIGASMAGGVWQFAK